jgi:hypothetical protein
MSRRASWHFHQRVRERVGSDVTPGELARGIKWAVENHRTDVAEYLGRVGRKGERLFRVRTPDGRFWRVVYDTRNMTAVTIFPDEVKP